MHQSKLYEHGFEKPASVAKKNRFPLKSICSSCGREKFLFWIVGKKYLCRECKELLESNKL